MKTSIRTVAMLMNVLPTRVQAVLDVRTLTVLTLVSVKMDSNYSLTNHAPISMNAGLNGNRNFKLPV